MTRKRCPHCGAQVFGLVSRCHKCKREIQVPEAVLKNIEARPLSDSKRVDCGHSSNRWVTKNKNWQCPSCEAILEKPSIGTLIIPGETVSGISGYAHCPQCGGQFWQADVYAGCYDICAAVPDGSSVASQVCVCCTRNVYPSSAFDLSSLASRIAATEGGLGFKCQSCSQTFCAPCLSDAPRHSATGGRACLSCGGALDVWEGCTMGYTACRRSDGPDRTTKGQPATQNGAEGEQEASPGLGALSKKPIEAAGHYRCPRCGAMFPQLDWRCPDCYLEFEDHESIS